MTFGRAASSARPQRFGVGQIDREKVAPVVVRAAASQNLGAIAPQRVHEIAADKPARPRN